MMKTKFEKTFRSLMYFVVCSSLMVSVEAFGSSFDVFYSRDNPVTPYGFTSKEAPFARKIIHAAKGTQAVVFTNYCEKYKFEDNKPVLDLMQLVSSLSTSRSDKVEALLKQEFRNSAYKLEVCYRQVQDKYPGSDNYVSGKILSFCQKELEAYSTSLLDYAGIPHFIGDNYLHTVDDKKIIEWLSMEKRNRKEFGGNSKQ